MRNVYTLAIKTQPPARVKHIISPQKPRLHSNYGTNLGPSLIYRKALIFCVTIFSPANDFGYIHENVAIIHLFYYKPYMKYIGDDFADTFLMSCEFTGR